jgi:hypothetical protein
LKVSRGVGGGDALTRLVDSRRDNRCIREGCEMGEPEEIRSQEIHQGSQAVGGGVDAVLQEGASQPSSRAAVRHSLGDRIGTGVN